MSQEFFVKGKYPKVIKQPTLTFIILLYSGECTSMIIDPENKLYKIQNEKTDNDIDNFLNSIIDSIEWILMMTGSNPPLDINYDIILSIHTDCIPGINLVKEWIPKWINSDEIEKKSNKTILLRVHELLNFMSQYTIVYDNIIRNVKLSELDNGTACNNAFINKGLLKE